LHRRAEVSQKTNERLLDALASVDDSRSIEELTAEIQKHTTWCRRRVRGLRPWAEDKELLAAINHGDFLINGFRNRDIQKILYGAEAESPVAPPAFGGHQPEAPLAEGARNSSESASYSPLSSH
jgi:hypothetical protein